MVRHHFTSAASPARVVILGSAGFLASELRRSLEAAKIPYRAVGSKEVDLTASSAREALAAIVQPQDAVIVTSALTPDKGRDVATLFKNLHMGEHLAAFLDRGRCVQVVYVSSDGIYDTRSSFISEISPCETGDMYAMAHVVREKLMVNGCQKAGIPLMIVRPCAIYGAGDTHNSYGPNRFLRSAIQDGNIAIFGRGEEQRDHIYVKDVAEIIRRCVVQRSEGVLNAVTGRARSFREIAEITVAALGKPVSIQQLPRSGPITHRHYDVGELIRAFPDFHPTAFERGIKETIADSRGTAGRS